MVAMRHRTGAYTREPDEWTPELLEKVAWRREAAAEPFRGVATSGGIQRGLFPLRETGLDVRPQRKAAEDYLALLTPKELAEGRFPMDDVTWRHWANGARYFLRHGLCMEDLDEPKRRAIMTILRRSLSPYGYQQVVDLMHLNLTVGELRGEEHLLNEWMYWFSVYGEPEDGGPWGWQIDGHHVNVNCAFVGDQMVLTPTFLGAEPVVAKGGKYAGTSAFRREEAIGRALFTRLTDAQRGRAVIAEELPRGLYAGAFRDNWEMDYAGLPFGELTVEQRETAVDLLDLYVGRAGEGHAELRMAEVLGQETFFAWAGDPADVFYYRLHSPVLLVEFEHQWGVMFDNDEPMRHHIHTIVRTPNGNDYGADLLRQHNERFHRR
ncbi:DUF3500 domain-containing protein [Actinomadura montaniterrae]|uniref:DUF3500 domain-containing protein n=1 Tax=Actinomadura montaniterrae TaxID=1803903 RepID=A0A6L3W657_9ACTN|nr:DUF3500 domain-containing protein [Actinomadura montaniterrae]KAB2390270.1 DUF3500 domain-containing protein [Actinomadura montaniterrae]